MRTPSLSGAICLRDAAHPYSAAGNRADKGKADPDDYDEGEDEAESEPDDEPEAPDEETEREDE